MKNKTYLSLGGISLMAIKTGQIETHELLKTGIPSVLIRMDKLFGSARTPPSLHSFLYSAPSITSLIWPEEGWYLS